MKSFNILFSRGSARAIADASKHDVNKTQANGSRTGTW